MRRIEAYFDPSAIHVVRLAHYHADQDATHRSVLEFLGASTDPVAMAAMSDQKTLHTREGQAVDTGLLRALRGKSWYNSVNMLLPKPIIALGKKLLRREIHYEIEWDEALRSDISAQLNEEWDTFKERYVSAPTG